MRELQTRILTHAAARAARQTIALVILSFGAAVSTAAQTPPAADRPQPPPRAASAQPVVGDEAGTIVLELRVFDGTEEVTGETRLRLFPRGQRTNDLPMTSAPGQAITAVVPVGFYDAQAIREKRGQVVALRWAEQLLVQRYPDEYGRHLEVINFKPGYGALQIRPARDAVAAAKGWTAVAHPAGDPAREVGKALVTGEDLLFALPSGSYDVKLTMGDKSTQWIRDVEVPADRTRLKTWTATPSSR
jgi:hypothetical protein